MNRYRLRPGYGSEELLLEFVQGPERESFVAELMHALQSLNVRVQSTEYLLMNEEVLLSLQSDQGAFELSIDCWGLGFIMAKNNQDILIQIDAILVSHPHYQKEFVDFENYKTKK